jgi:signal transduction histidine kinase
MVLDTQAYEDIHVRLKGYRLKLPAATSESGVSSRTFLVRLSVVVILANLFVIAFSGIMIYQLLEHDKNRIRVHTQNLSTSIEQSIVNILEKSDVALLSVVDEAETQIAGGTMNGRLLNNFISRLHAQMSELHGLRMTNARGDVIYGTGLDPDHPVNIADRDYFISARDNPKGGLVISEPLFGRITRKWVINIARRVNHADGSFAGVAYGAFSIDYFLKHFSAFNIGENGTITLRTSELITVVRYRMGNGADTTLGKKVISPEYREKLRSNSNYGTFTDSSLIDNEERTYSYRKISGYPLYVTVGLATRDYLADWRNEAAKGMLLVATFMATTVVSAWLVLRYWNSRKKAQDELRSYHEHLEELVKERTSELESFNYTVSHDLRKPLTIISGYCGVIGELYDNEGRDYLHEIENGVNSMSALIDTLLKFSCLANREPNRETVNLSELALETAGSLKTAEPGRRVVFRIGEGITANGDRNLLRIVLENLLGNAWKYTHLQEEPVIEFGTTDVKGQTAYFIRDNGSGFDMSHADEIFIPFRRLSEAQESSGYGIGLATVGKIIKRHGGRIWAEGAPDKGATFIFTL